MSDLPLARNRLADAVHALADRQPIWVGGMCRWQEPLYTRLRSSLEPRNQSGRRQVPGSRAPCRTDALVWLIDVDMTVGAWDPDGDGALDRLRRLRDRRWAPEDVEKIESYTEQIQKWSLAAVELLGDRPPTVSLRLPCPACGTKHVRSRNGVGEIVRRWALSISDEGARCAACRAAWKPEQFEFLATLLGCPALPA